MDDFRLSMFVKGDKQDIRGNLSEFNKSFKLSGQFVGNYSPWSKGIFVFKIAANMWDWWLLVLISTYLSKYIKRLKMVTAKRLVIKEILNHSSNSRKMVNKSEIKTLKKRAVIKIDLPRINYVFLRLTNGLDTLSQHFCDGTRSNTTTSFNITASPSRYYSCAR